MRKFLSILAFIPTLLLAQTPNVWDGTADVSWYQSSAQAYNLTTAEQLAGLAQLVNNGNTFVGKTITLGADIFLNDTTGRTSKNFTVDSETKNWIPIGSSQRPFQGEFDGVAGTKSRKIYGLYISSTNSSIGLFGKVSGTLSNLDILVGKVTTTKDTVGALVGRGSTIKNVKTDVVVSGNNYVGGLAGIGDKISKSYSTGDVTGSGDYVGGLVGNGANISDSYSTGDVTGTASVGGLVGNNSSGTISNSYSEGSLVKGIFQVGGLVGKAGTGTGINNSHSLQAKVIGDDNVGGLIGSSYAEVSKSFAKSNVSCDEANASAGCDNLGGLIGYAYSGSVEKSFATGNVEGTTKLGGLVGRADGITISNSYARGNVTGSFYGDPADEVGNYYIGGLLGYANGATKIQKSYASGKVSGAAFTGSLLGSNAGSATITNSYYDKETTGQSLVVGDDNMLTATSETTAKMKTQSTFAGWDFTSIWKIKNGETYPYFIYEESISTPIRIPQIANSNIRIKAIGNAILLENLPKNAKIELYNLQGRQIYSGNSGNAQILRILVQTKGMYIAKVQENRSSNKVQTKVIVR
jgi:hypothetical protein